MSEHQKAKEDTEICSLPSFQGVALVRSILQHAGHTTNLRDALASLGRSHGIRVYNPGPPLPVGKEELEKILQAQEDIPPEWRKFRIFFCKLTVREVPFIHFADDQWHLDYRDRDDEVGPEDLFAYEPEE